MRLINLREHTTVILGVTCVSVTSMMGKTGRITSTTLITNVVTLWGRTKHTDLVNLKIYGKGESYLL